MAQQPALMDDGQMSLILFLISCLTEVRAEPQKDVITCLTLVMC